MPKTCRAKVAKARGAQRLARQGSHTESLGPARPGNPARLRTSSGVKEPAAWNRGRYARTARGCRTFFASRNPTCRSKPAAQAQESRRHRPVGRCVASPRPRQQSRSLARTYAICSNEASEEVPNAVRQARPDLQPWSSRRRLGPPGRSLPGSGSREQPSAAGIIFKPSHAVDMKPEFFGGCGRERSSAKSERNCGERARVWPERKWTQ